MRVLAKLSYLAHIRPPRKSTGWTTKRPGKEKAMYLNTHDIGWRLRTLRIRYGLSLSDVAQRSNLDISYISRLERDALANAKPKPDTINRVLEAIGASPAE